jgi:hypothetical protein
MFLAAPQACAITAQETSRKLRFTLSRSNTAPPLNIARPLVPLQWITKPFFSSSLLLDPERSTCSSSTSPAQIYAARLSMSAPLSISAPPRSIAPLLAPASFHCQSEHACMTGEKGDAPSICFPLDGMHLHLSRIFLYEDDSIPFVLEPNSLQFQNHQPNTCLVHQTSS